MSWILISATRGCSYLSIFQHFSAMTVVPINRLNIVDILGKIILYFQGEIADIDEDSSDEKENIADGEDCPTIKTEEKKVEKKHKTDQDIEDEYGLNEYDDEEDGIDSKKLFGLGDLTVFADPGEDPYLDQEQPDEDEEDVEDFKIR